MHVDRSRKGLNLTRLVGGGLASVSRLPMRTFCGAAAHRPIRFQHLPRSKVNYISALAITGCSRGAETSVSSPSTTGAATAAASRWLAAVALRCLGNRQAMAAPRSAHHHDELSLVSGCSLGRGFLALAPSWAPSMQPTFAGVTDAVVRDPDLPEIDAEAIVRNASSPTSNSSIGAKSILRRDRNRPLLGHTAARLGGGVHRERLF